MTRYGYRIIHKVPKPTHVIFAIPMQSWNPYHETELVTFANGDPVHTNHTIHDYKASACLRNLHLRMDSGRILITCDDINFDCMPAKANKPTENKIQTCLKRMQADKCPYKISRYLFPNIPPKKHR